MGQLPRLVASDFVAGQYGHWIVLMALSWFVLLITGSLSGYWYQAVLTKKLPYSVWVAAAVGGAVRSSRLGRAGRE